MAEGTPTRQVKPHRSTFGCDVKIAAQLGALYDTVTARGKAAVAPQGQDATVTRHHARIEQARRELERLEGLRAAMATVVDHLQCGLVFLDSGGRILRANVVARAMFEKHRAVCGHGCLEGSDRAQTAALRQAIHRASSW